MPARKLTVTPEGETVVYSTKRGKPTQCSENCAGVYKFCGELYCKYFNCVVGKRDKDCVNNTVKGV